MKHNQKFDTELLHKLSDASESNIVNMRNLIRKIGFVVGVDIEKLTLLRSMESFAEEKGIRL